MDNRHHWENIYERKQSHEVSWTQDTPATSLQFIQSLQLPKSASIIDIGGGESRLVDFLLHEGYENITVLDISANALEKTKQRLGPGAQRVKWIVSDITAFEPDTTYDIWHDRATFHFLTTPAQIARYLQVAGQAVNGYLVIGTFSENGPETCSGLPIQRYSEASLEQQLSPYFEKVRCIKEEHVTPFQTRQEFLFCLFKRKQQE
ncbi:class I SAM-dependent methyltransferase [Chitinophaga japonensis]|uniref:Methyltransferase family protein n=1 Tax=Chitinophaga japonensis TaxID=104662 RepID=A0A562SI88_CHIJA|nr:class I SAM-dependent methyltransferase [Chitinophaga japonensis]TWI80997.1 methyltransferase family protein [Chitinophaga japonensis]